MTATRGCCGFWLPSDKFFTFFDRTYSIWFYNNTQKVSITGNFNGAGGAWSVVGGGQSNNANGVYSSVSGGDERTASAEHDWAAGGAFEDF